jgi:hypothetical protein
LPSDKLSSARFQKYSATIHAVEMLNKNKNIQ